MAGLVELLCLSPNGFGDECLKISPLHLPNLQLWDLVLQLRLKEVCCGQKVDVKVQKETTKNCLVYSAQGWSCGCQLIPFNLIFKIVFSRHCEALLSSSCLGFAVSWWWSACSKIVGFMKLSWLPSPFSYCCREWGVDFLTQIDRHVSFLVLALLRVCSPPSLIRNCPTFSFNLQPVK